jgi:hypothetical protein
MEKKWWARVPCMQDNYGSWVPTGETDLGEAKFYIKHVLCAGPVKEWLLL